MSNYKFETLQLHVGQEQADPATDIPITTAIKATKKNFICFINIFFRFCKDINSNSQLINADT